MLLSLAGGQLHAERTASAKALRWKLAVSVVDLEGLSVGHVSQGRLEEEEVLRGFWLLLGVRWDPLKSFERRSLKGSQLLNRLGWGAWVAQSVKRPTSAQVTSSRFAGPSPASGSVPTARSPEPASGSGSPSLSAPPLLARACSLSLSKNKYTLKQNLNRLGRGYRVMHGRGRHASWAATAGTK